MKIALKLILVSLFICLFPATQANAAPEGCPDGWVVPIDAVSYESWVKSNFPRLNTEFKFNYEYFYSLDGKMWIPDLEGLAKFNWLSFTAGKDYKSIITMERLGCSTKKTVEVRSKISGVEFIPINPVEWVETSEIRKHFSNDQDRLNMLSTILAFPKSMNDLSASVRDSKNPTAYAVFPKGWGQIFGLNKDVSLTIFPKNSDCLKYTNGFVQSHVVRGMKCDVVLGYPVPNISTGQSQDSIKIYVLSTALIDTTSVISTILCVKGKLTKKVTAVKPVCPGGYKKK